jgi:hypothetical protein
MELYWHIENLLNHGLYEGGGPKHNAIQVRWPSLNDAKSFSRPSLVKYSGHCLNFKKNKKFAPQHT